MLQSTRNRPLTIGFHLCDSRHIKCGPCKTISHRKLEEIMFQVHHNDLNHGLYNLLTYFGNIIYTPWTYRRVCREFVVTCQSAIAEHYCVSSVPAGGGLTSLEMKPRHFQLHWALWWEPSRGRTSGQRPIGSGEFITPYSFLYVWNARLAKGL